MEDTTPTADSGEVLRSLGVVRTAVPLVDAGVLAELPPGTAFVAPSLVLIPAGPRVAVGSRAAALLFPRGATRHDFRGSCKPGVPPRRADLEGWALLPRYVAEALPRGVCLPEGQLWVRST